MFRLFHGNHQENSESLKHYKLLLKNFCAKPSRTTNISVPSPPVLHKFLCQTLAYYKNFCTKPSRTTQICFYQIVVFNR